MRIGAGTVRTRLIRCPILPCLLCLFCMMTAVSAFGLLIVVVALIQGLNV